ncbi:hypothetical protein R3I93_010663 [Phoxinus phoxinus]|uniref:Uncharacterized protein n=1 Tax=Phoxinus phoxinus TaxID=58324 RepID=A0AAN9CYQ7_9TELE
MSLSDIKPPPKDFNGHMDMDDFWDKLALQMIGPTLPSLSTPITTFGHHGLEEIHASPVNA